MKIWSRFNCVTRAAPTSFIYSSFGKGPLPARFIGNFLEARGGTYLANQQYLVNYIKYHQVVLLSGLDFSHWKAWTLRTCWAPCCFCYGQSGFPYWLRWIILILQRFNAQIHPPNLVFQNDCCCWSGDAAGAGAGRYYRFWPQILFQAHIENLPHCRRRVCNDDWRIPVWILKLVRRRPYTICCESSNRVPFAVLDVILIQFKHGCTRCLVHLSVGTLRTVLNVCWMIVLTDLRPTFV